MNFIKSTVFFLICLRNMWSHGAIRKLNDINYLPESNATLCMEKSSDINGTKTPLQCSCETSHFSTEVKTCDICCFKEDNSKLQCKAVCTADVPRLTQDMYEKDIKRLIKSFSNQQDNSPELDKEKLLASTSDQTLSKTIIKTNQGTQYDIGKPEEPTQEDSNIKKSGNCCETRNCE